MDQPLISFGYERGHFFSRRSATNWLRQLFEDNGQSFECQMEQIIFQCCSLDKNSREHHSCCSFLYIRLRGRKITRSLPCEDGNYQWSTFECTMCFLNTDCTHFKTNCYLNTIKIAFLIQKHNCSGGLKVIPCIKDTIGTIGRKSQWI